MDMDILIRNADLADGSGGPVRRADIAVRGGIAAPSWRLEWMRTLREASE